VSVVRGFVLCLREGELSAEGLVDPLEALEKFFGKGVDGFGSWVSHLDRATGMSSVISIEGGNLGGGMFGVVIGEFCEGEEVVPVVLLIVTEDAEVLLQDLVYSFGLAIRLRVIRCGPVPLDLA